MHIQLPLALDSEKSLIVRDIIQLLPDFDADFLEGVLDVLSVSPFRGLRPALRIAGAISYHQHPAAVPETVLPRRF